jgi:hypothetical protein
MEKIGLVLLFALMISTAPAAPSYRAGPQIGKGEFDRISYLAVAPDDRIYALAPSGIVKVFSPEGELLDTLESGLENTETLAIGPGGKLYVFSTLTEQKKVKVGARMRKVEVPSGVKYAVLSPAGERLETVSLDGLRSAKAARIMGGRLIVADLSARTLVFFDLAGGREIQRIKKGLRLVAGN